MREPTISCARSRAACGYALAWLGELASAGAVLLCPSWLVHLLSPTARPGSELMLGPAIFIGALAATTFVRSRLRAAMTLTGGAAAAAGAAAVWPLPAPAWILACAAAASL